MFRCFVWFHTHKVRYRVPLLCTDSSRSLSDVTPSPYSHLVVNGHLSHLWLHPVPLFLLHLLGILLLEVCLPHLTNARGLDVVRELEGRLLNPSLALQVGSFLRPVTGDRDCVAVCLRGVEGGDVGSVVT